MTGHSRSSDLLLVRSAPTLPDTMQARVLTDAAGAPLSLRAAAEAESGVFEGYACLWDVTDAYGTRFAPGCFGAGGLDGDPYALLWMHNPTEVIGTFTAKEDDRGLYIAGAWDDTDEGTRARGRARSGSAGELSVGFVPLMLDPDDENRFTQARLVETSQITRRMAAVPGAAFATVRSSLPRGPVDGEPDDDGEPSDAAVRDASAASRAHALLMLSTPVRSLEQ